MAVIDWRRREDSNEPSFVTLFSVQNEGRGRRLKGGLMWTDCLAIGRWRHVVVLGRRRSNSSARSLGSRLFSLSLSRAACLFCLCISTRFPPNSLHDFFPLHSTSSSSFFLFLTTTLSFFYVVVTFADPFYHRQTTHYPARCRFWLTVMGSVSKWVSTRAL